jgi:hypothetical protein
MRQTIIAITIGVILGGMALYTVYTVYQHDKKIDIIVNFLNSQVNTTPK